MGNGETEGCAQLISQKERAGLRIWTTTSPESTIMARFAKIRCFLCRQISLDWGQEVRELGPFQGLSPVLDLSPEFRRTKIKLI